MLLVLAVLLALFALIHWPWNAVLIIVAAVIETSQTAFWFWWTHRARPRVGAEAMIGARAEVVERGWVRVHGELWQARSEHEARPGETVRVKAIDGLTLIVE
jgi:membrane-bound serine protease (ClpP class)